MTLVPIEKLQDLILLIRGHKVMLDADLAKLYGVNTKALNQAVKRNQERFPPDFVFPLTEDEKEELVTICDRFKNLKHSNVLPRVFTEHGAIMLANVLRNPLAIQASIAVVRAFIYLRETLVLNHNLLLHLKSQS